MKIKYSNGICNGCGESKLIVHKSKKLCTTCLNRTKVKNKPIKSKVYTLKRTPLKRSTKKIEQFSKSGKIRKAKDIDFYKESWEARQDWKGGCVCEECRVYLPAYSSAFVSHILSRGAYPEFAHNKKNYNILCLKHHNQWETGDRESMSIYEKNQKIIQELFESSRK